MPCFIFLLCRSSVRLAASFCDLFSAGRHLCIKVLEAANIKTEGRRRNAALKICRLEAQQAADVPGNAVIVNGPCVLMQREAIGGQMETSEKCLSPAKS